MDGQRSFGGGIWDRVATAEEIVDIGTLLPRASTPQWRHRRKSSRGTRFCCRIVRAKKITMYYKGYRAGVRNYKAGEHSANPLLS